MNNFLICNAQIPAWQHCMASLNIQPCIEIFRMEVFHWRRKNLSINHHDLQCGGFQLEDEQLFIESIDISKQAPEAAGETGKTGEKGESQRSQL